MNFKFIYDTIISELLACLHSFVSSNQNTFPFHLSLQWIEIVYEYRQFNDALSEIEVSIEVQSTIQ